MSENVAGADGTAPVERAAGPSELLLAVWLLVFAGFIDAIAFSALQGNFVAFMTGNTTIAALATATGEWELAVAPAALLVLFFLGCVLGAVVVRFSRRSAHRTLMIVIAALTLVSAVLANTVSQTVGVSLMAIVGGMTSSALASNSDVKVGLSYVTGTLVKSAHDLVSGIGSRHPWAWLRSIRFWFVFAVGALLGGLAYHALHLASMWIALVIAVVACLLPHRRAE